MGFVNGLLRGSLVVCVCALISGCGDVLSSIGGGGKSGGGDKTTLSSIGPDGQPGRATGSVSGVVMSGTLAGSDVRVFGFGSGTKGDMLAAGQTDAQGKYSIDLTVISQPILVEVSGGRYTEPASSRTIALSDGQVLLAVQNYLSGNTLSVSPTYYTTLAVGLAETLVRMGAMPPQAVVDANRRISAIVGLAAGFDAVANTPVDISSPASVTPFVSTELEYGFATAALSSLTEAASVTANRPVHETINSIALIQLALDDVRHDGVLDGQGTQGALAIGVTPLSANVYRNTLALNVLRIASNTQSNQSSIGPAQVLPLAQRLNNSTDPIYGGRPIVPLNVDAPMIADLSIAPNALIAGDVTLTATATSLFGIASVELLVDNVVVGTALDSAQVSIPFDTTTVADGSHQLSVRAADLIGGKTTTPAFAVAISNAEGRISNISLANDSFVRGTIAVTADIVDGAGIAQVRYLVDNFQPVVTTDPRAPFQLDTVGLRLADDLGHTLRITATNNLGREITSPVINFRVDNQAPTVVITSPAPDEFVTPKFILAASATDNGPLGRLEVHIDGDPRPDITRVPEGFFINTENFLEGDHVLAVQSMDQAGNNATASVPVVFDYTPPTVVVTSPARNAAIRGPFDVVATLSDNLALGTTVTTMLLDSATSLGGAVAPTNVSEQGRVTQGTVTQRIEGAAIPGDGPRSYVVVARDRSGNTSTSAPIDVVIDNTPPEIRISQTAPESCVFSGSFFDISPISEATMTFEILGQSITRSLNFPSFSLDAVPEFTLRAVDTLGNAALLQVRVRVTTEGGPILPPGGGQAPQPNFPPSARRCALVSP